MSMDKKKSSAFQSSKQECRNTLLSKQSQKKSNNKEKASERAKNRVKLPYTKGQKGAEE